MSPLLRKSAAAPVSVPRGPSPTSVVERRRRERARREHLCRPMFSRDAHPASSPYRHPQQRRRDREARKATEAS